ncbi:hypothetical protein [Stenotrophomonas rhizophila]|uniref:hypothetical protein n=1 Tax=Stenotrophomonas rhizophila TaxID=216778 RepID=UPI0028A78708|nr:hypothetical protein [Stenotrophomonas rhizophila]
MTQRHLSHPDWVPRCATGHSARYTHDLRGTAAGGGYFAKCRCKATPRHANAEAALDDCDRINKRRCRRPPTTPTNVAQLPLQLAAANAASRRQTCV